MDYYIYYEQYYLKFITTVKTKISVVYPVGREEPGRAHHQPTLHHKHPNSQGHHADEYDRTMVDHCGLWAARGRRQDRISPGDPRRSLNVMAPG
jgi:hypothetical protein